MQVHEFRMQHVPACQDSDRLGLARHRNALALDLGQLVQNGIIPQEFRPALGELKEELAILFKHLLHELAL